MNEQAMEILGVCRFSMLGRGDWKAYRNKTDDELEATYLERGKELFAPERIEHRLASFEHLTLNSLRNQTDSNFRFLVVSSDRMPEEYRVRLQAICESCPQVVLMFTEPMHITDVVRQYIDRSGLNLRDCVQFRLDDDDCVSRDYIRVLRRHAQAMWGNGAFAVSFPSILYCVTDGPTEGVYEWFNPFLGAGVAVRHPGKTVFEFAHYRIPQRMIAVTDPGVPCIVTHAGDNDTPRHEPHILRKRGMEIANEERLARTIAKHFGFLSEEGLQLAALKP